MSYLDTLLQDVEVEWKRIWEVTTWDKKFNAVDNYKQPKTIKYHHLLSNEIKPLIKDKGDVKLLTTNETDFWTSEELAGSIISDSEVVAIPWGGNVIVQYYKGKFLTGDNRIAVSNDTNYLNTKFLYYFLKNNLDLLESFYRGAGIKHPSMASILDVQIPIPPLLVQTEIVRILDTFTEHISELTAELKARKKQYEYYETKLLFDNNFDMKPLSELCTVNQGLQIPINERKTEEGINRYFYITVQFLKGNDISYYIESPMQSVICNYDDILVTRTGSTGKIITGVKGCFHNNFFKVNCFENIINKRYMYCVLNSKVMFGKLLHAASGGTVPDLPHGKFYKLTIPVPPLEEQERIVSILDKFEKLTNSTNEGLPKEIKLRQKQYEYYREQLLMFNGK